jgi:hypothetical protein
MLLIVVNDEQAEHQESGEDAANEFGGEIEIPNGSSDGSEPQDGGGKNARPTSHCVIHGVGPGREDEFSACPDAGLIIIIGIRQDIIHARQYRL